jgi:hypothetical protein
MSTDDPFVAGPRDQIADLQRALAHQRALTEQQRKRAELAEASRDRAWRVAASGGGGLTGTRERRKIRDS